MGGLEEVSRLRVGDIVRDRYSGFERYFFCRSLTRLNEELVYTGVTVTKIPLLGADGMKEVNPWHVQNCGYNRQIIDDDPETYPVVGHVDPDQLIIDGVLKVVKG